MCVLLTGCVTYFWVVWLLDEVIQAVSVSRDLCEFTGVIFERLIGACFSCSVSMVAKQLGVRLSLAHGVDS